MVIPLFVHVACPKHFREKDLCLILEWLSEASGCCCRASRLKSCDWLTSLVNLVSPFPPPGCAEAGRHQHTAPRPR